VNRSVDDNNERCSWDFSEDVSRMTNDKMIKLLKRSKITQVLTAVYRSADGKGHVTYDFRVGHKLYEITECFNTMPEALTWVNGLNELAMEES